MEQVVIENPILNSPFGEPQKHFRFSEDGITNEVVEARRVSSYFIPIARPKKRAGQMQLPFDTEWTQDRLEENKFINQIRARIDTWRRGGYLGVTKTTAQLLSYWTDTARERRLFFCQVEALEAIIYITEVAKKYNDTWIENTLRSVNKDTSSLYRIAFKMATGSGKTVVMAMLIAWHTLNKLNNPQDARFSDTFLIVAPGITIKDRLRVLLPNDPENYYQQRDIVPPNLLEELNRAKILITNFHIFQLHEQMNASKLTKTILTQDGANSLVETPDQMVRRACRELGTKKNIVVINDEAHHCYRRKPDIIEKVTGDERQEIEKREEEARIWLSGLEAIQAKIGIKVVYDLSATPFFLRGSGYPEGTLFPWVVSDFSLIDAIESGIVKVPRVPVVDDSMIGEQPTYRNLWLRVRDSLPKKGRKTDELNRDLPLPVELESALRSLYSNYETYYHLWESISKISFQAIPPPVLIVVCSNTNVSKLIFDYIAGKEKVSPDGTPMLVYGKLPIFSNVEDGRWKSRPNTVLIDSQQLESGEAMSTDFKKVAAREIENFKRDYQLRFPGRDAESLTDEDLLREVMNTVGKPGKLGEQVKCVVSVSMLTEGWDANTVTHILGVRAFGTQLLCEQVVGRGLRRTYYVPNEQGMFEPEYAEVYGIPFSFIPSSGSVKEPKPGIIPTRVRALPERSEREISFPILTGYRYEIPGEEIIAHFTEASTMVVSTRDVPSMTENAPIIGPSSIHTLFNRPHRKQEVAFHLSKSLLDLYFRDDKGFTRPWLFPQILRVAKEWLEQCVIYQDNTSLQWLMIEAKTQEACEHIYQAIVWAEHGKKVLKPILRPYDNIGSTASVRFDTIRPVYLTRPDRCHISHTVLDSDWEAKMVEFLEGANEVFCYVKNYGLGFTIPYTIEGVERNFVPDFIARINDGHGPDDLLNLVIEVSGEARKDKLAKVNVARSLWVPAVNNYGSFGRWAFLEVRDPWNVRDVLWETVR